MQINDPAPDDRPEPKVEAAPVSAQPEAPSAKPADPLPSEPALKGEITPSDVIAARRDKKIIFVTVSEGKVPALDAVPAAKLSTSALERASDTPGPTPAAIHNFIQKVIAASQEFGIPLTLYGSRTPASLGLQSEGILVRDPNQTVANKGETVFTATTDDHLRAGGMRSRGRVIPHGSRV